MKQESAVPTPPRSPWQHFYGAMHALRWHWYARRSSRLPRPVISVGNIHWGGAGKTPIVAAIARYLRDKGKVVAILSRGYGSQAKGIRVVSTGEGPLLGPLVAGDEPVLLASELPGVAVVVAPNRAEAGLHAMERLSPPPDFFVLDDGFSHLKLFREVDLVVFPAADRWAGGRLLPGGRLREPLSSLDRADAVILSDASQTEAEEFARQLQAFNFTGPGFSSRVAVRLPELPDGQEMSPGTAVLVVTAIARPRRVVDSVRQLGLEVADVLTFSDHHNYPEGSIRKINEKFQESRASAIVTTSKDHVKLLGRLEAPLAQLPIQAEPDPSFFGWLDQRLVQAATLETPE